MKFRFLLPFCAVLLAVSASATELSLLTAGSSGSITTALGTAYFFQIDPQSTGSGVIDPFVRLSPQGNNSTEQGFNTDGRPYIGVNDAGNTATFNHAIQVSEFETHYLPGSGTEYLRFLLDINENNNRAGDQFISLDDVELYTATVGDIDSYAGLQALSSNPVWDMGTPTDDTPNRVLLNYALNAGSGSGDMWMYIPKSLFGASTNYIYLYSAFGYKATTTDPENRIWGVSDGFEEWANVLGAPAIPEPSFYGLLSLGLTGLFLAARRRKSQAE